MCGIFAVHNYQGDINAYRKRVLRCSKKLRHRGPDWSGCVIKANTILAHERLAIVGVGSGAQPIKNADESIVLAVNGEIYNHKGLEKIVPGAVFSTQSDCECILHVYAQKGNAVVEHLDGMFSFVLFDVRNNKILAARDPIGITPLYQGWSSGSPDTVYFASEMKALQDECDKIISFPPGHFYDSSTKETTRYYRPPWWNSSDVPTAPIDYKLLRETLEKAVRKRLMSEVPYGVLLSGGLDSSLIASIAQRESIKLANQNGFMEDDVDESAFESWPKLHSFSIGLPHSPDLAAARKVADFLHTMHHEFTFTIQEGLDALHDVVYHLETYDVTTVRASTPMYLLSRKIKAMGVKMVLSGEGSDEIFGGYLYFHAAPTAADFHEETVTRVKNLHTSDCLRANKSTMAWGLEARVPFLDAGFLNVAMSVNPEEKLFKPGGEKMEKYILRKAFDVSTTDDDRPYLPDSILWRQKEQFSDGVGYSWIDSLKATAEKHVSDEQLATAGERWSKDTPTTKEAYWYREMFEDSFPEDSCVESVVRWIPRSDWGCPEDPSGRAQAVHNAAYANNK